MPDIALRNLGHDIEPTFKKYRSASSPDHTPPPSPTTARANIEALMPLQDRVEVRRVMARHGAQAVLQNTAGIPRQTLDTAIRVAHRGEQLDPQALQQFLRELHVDVHDTMAADVFDDPDSKKQPLLSDKPQVSVKRPRRRPVSRRKMEKRASCFDRQTVTMLAPIIGSLPQQARDMHSIKAQNLALDQKLDHIIKQNERIAEDTSAQTGDNAQPDWDRQYGLEYIRARWRLRGERFSKVWFKTMGYIALRCLRETATWALGLVSLALPIRLFDRGR